jgi:nucleotide-binding universal stress UspA family protein
MTTRSQIVVGVDGSAGSKHAVEWAARQARLEGKSLLAVNAWEPVAVGWTPYPTALMSSMAAEQEKVLQEALDEVLGEDRGVDVETQVLCGSPGRKLVSVSDGAALLVVGRHGRHRLTGQLGSVSGYCARHAPCPVVVVHP